MALDTGQKKNLQKYGIATVFGVAVKDKASYRKNPAMCNLSLTFNNICDGENISVILFVHLSQQNGLSVYHHIHTELCCECTSHSHHTQQ